ncbi:MAG: 1-deoxy-D-xylulose-5-phosphate reductoisomerase [Burkholderiales bacterium PBB4]|nr:MAG: 1-deoxy-D-xylulose-5-phosphate reductoisomerase [Burkholderiales bacterium PBB4]
MSCQRLRVVVLGSTGSIGVNTLDVIARHPDRFEVFALTASTNVETMLAQCAKFHPQIAVMVDPVCGKNLQERCRAIGLRTEVVWGAASLVVVAAHPQADAVMAAIVGAAGLAPCLAAAKAGKRLMLANKEALVVGGDLFMRAVREGGATLLPIDSEHSAIFQSLPQDPSTWKHTIDKIILTASGGPFRQRDPQSFHTVSPAEACTHPNWVMGRKISVDSATMMNKALEVIEARYLFDVMPDQIEVVIHPQSVIHSMVQFVDNSVVAQLGTPDMRGPIAYGLSWPQRVASGATALDFSSLQSLTFEAADSAEHQKRFPGLALAWQVLNDAPGKTAVLNAANEMAVAGFLDGKIRFDQIYAVNAEALEQVVFASPGSLDELLELDALARRHADQVMARLSA